jgi:RecA-family ATPase
VHAIVHVDATNREEYAKRVRWLYDYCDRHGFVTDKQNKNQSRLSRMPGATRNGRRQLLLATNIGEESWDAWRKWAEESEDDLPDAEHDDWDAPINLKPMLIGQTEQDCILRQGAKMIVVGDSKMGKSYTLIDLAEAIACGGEWLGMKCDAGPIFYVNLEIDPEEFRWRQHKVWDARPESADDGMVGAVSHNFVRWNLRGYATNMDKLAPRLVRRVLSYGPPGTFKAIIIDPIYKVNGGDDNNASEVSKFTNTLDMIIMSCGCSVIYAHHHPKGAVGGRKSIDRMSGSGVYGRDADTVMDFTPLFVPEDIWASYDHKPVYRAELDCRSFKHRKPIDCIFDWPRFHVDTEGKLADCKPLGADPHSEGRANGNKASTSKYESDRQKIAEAMSDAYDTCQAEEVRTTADNMRKRMQWDAFGLSSKSKTTLGTFVKWFKYAEVAELFEVGGSGKNATEVEEGVKVDYLVSCAED